MMAPDQVRHLLKAQPFSPFAVRMADGNEFFVKHPDFAFLAPTGRSLHVYQPDMSYSVLDVLLMTELRVDAAPVRSA